MVTLRFGDGKNEYPAVLSNRSDAEVYRRAAGNREKLSLGEFMSGGWRELPIICHTEPFDSIPFHSVYSRCLICHFFKLSTEAYPH